MDPKQDLAKAGLEALEAQVAIVYSHITGGVITDPWADPETVLEAANEWAGEQRAERG